MPRKHVIAKERVKERRGELLKGIHEIQHRRVEQNILWSSVLGILNEDPYLPLLTLFFLFLCPVIGIFVRGTLDFLRHESGDLSSDGDFTVLVGDFRV